MEIQKVGEMKNFGITFEDTQIIRGFEGYRNTAYPDPATGGDPWTIAWGLTGSWVTPGLTLTDEECKQKFMERINSTCSKLDSLIKINVTKNQYIAVLSLTWNVGLGNLSSSTLLKKLNAGDYAGAADQFLVWNKAAGKVLDGLTKRREAERTLFLS